MRVATYTRLGCFPIPPLCRLVFAPRSCSQLPLPPSLFLHLTRHALDYRRLGPDFGPFRRLPRLYFCLCLRRQGQHQQSLHVRLWQLQLQLRRDAAHWFVLHAVHVPLLQRTEPSAVPSQHLRPRVLDQMLMIVNFWRAKQLPTFPFPLELFSIDNCLPPHIHTPD
jgi:hypothetical protein